MVQTAQVAGTSEVRRICNAGLKQQVQEKSGERLDADERAELQSLRQEVKTLRMEKEIQKKTRVYSTDECKRQCLLWLEKS